MRLTVWPDTTPGLSSPLRMSYVPAGTWMSTVPPTLLARHVASRRLNVDGGVVIAVFPHAPVDVETSAVVLTFSVVAAAAGLAATPARTRIAATRAATKDFEPARGVLNMTNPWSSAND